MNWQPIETAPTDGSWVLVVGKGAPPAVARQLQRTWYIDAIDEGGEMELRTPPSHWTPLPVLPF